MKCEYRGKEELCWRKVNGCLLQTRNLLSMAPDPRGLPSRWTFFEKYGFFDK